MNEGIDFIGQGWAAGTSANKAKNCWAPWKVNESKGRVTLRAEVKAPQQYDNQGCGQKLPKGSFGPAFNRAGGVKCLGLEANSTPQAAPLWPSGTPLPPGA